MKTRWMMLSAALACSSILASPDTLTRKDRRVLERAPEVLVTIMSAPDQAIPEELLERAECLVVFPQVTKGAFIVGGRYGRGVATCRSADGTMGAPAFFSIGGASVGWQFGGKQTDLILLVMNRNGMEYLLKDKFTIGGEASAAVGPVGRTATASTDAQLHAQILSWSRSQGLFVGASIDGAVVKPDKDANLRLYNRDMAARDILAAGPIASPPAAQSFVEVARRLTGGREIGSNRPASN